MLPDATWSLATADQGYGTSSRCRQLLFSEAIPNAFGQFRFLDDVVLAVCLHLNVRRIFTDAVEPILFRRLIRPCRPLRDSVHGWGRSRFEQASAGVERM